MRIVDQDNNGRQNQSQIPQRLLIVFALILLTSLSAAQGSTNGGTSDSESTEASSPVLYHVTFTGLIRLVGNEPFTRLVITTVEGVDYIIEDPYREQYHDLQGTWVEAAGVVRESEVYAGHDKLIGVERWFTPDKLEPLPEHTPRIHPALEHPPEV